MKKTLEERVKGTIRWSFSTWHFYNYEGPTDITITSIAGKLYHITFSITTYQHYDGDVPPSLDHLSLHGLYMDVEIQGNSLFFDTDTLSMIIEPCVEAYADSAKYG